MMFFFVLSVSHGQSNLWARFLQALIFSLALPSPSVFGRSIPDRDRSSRRRPKQNAVRTAFRRHSYFGASVRIARERQLEFGPRLCAPSEASTRASRARRVQKYANTVRSHRRSTSEPFIKSVSRFPRKKRARPGRRRPRSQPDHHRSPRERYVRRASAWFRVLFDVVRRVVRHVVRRAVVGARSTRSAARPAGRSQAGRSGGPRPENSRAGPTAHAPGRPAHLQRRPLRQQAATGRNQAATCGATTEKQQAARVRHGQRRTTTAHTSGVLAQSSCTSRAAAGVGQSSSNGCLRRAPSKDTLA